MPIWNKSYANFSSVNLIHLQSFSLFYYKMLYIPIRRNHAIIYVFFSFEFYQWRHKEMRWTTLFGKNDDVFSDVIIYFFVCVICLHQKRKKKIFIQHCGKWVHVENSHSRNFINGISWDTFFFFFACCACVKSLFEWRQNSWFLLYYTKAFWINKIYIFFGVLI